jgi:transcriptional regulator with XRE-family HTH domain
MGMKARDDGRKPGHGQLLGTAIRHRREALGLTQEQLAEAVGGDVDGNYVTHLETGRRVRLPEQPILGQFARALKVREVDLLIDAGVITEPLPTEGASRELFDRGTPHHEAVLWLRRLDNARALEVARFAKFQFDNPIVEVPVVVAALPR